ncbi:MAG: glucan biosynthesis protein [Sphingobium sp.]
MTTRREAIAGLVGMAALARLAPLHAATGRGEPFSWELLQRRALALHRQAWRPPADAGALLDKMGYDAANDVEYRPDRTLWGDGGVRFFPLTSTARHPVSIAVVENGVARPFAYDPELYRHPADHPMAAIGQGGGFSGFRVMNPGGRGDWLAFQGASYFRAAGPLSQYGLSARGLAVNTGTNAPEEFPVFTHVWLERGQDGAITVHALLDGPSVAGAYRIVSERHAGETIQSVNSVLHMRRSVERLGIAPLTSMYWYAEGDRGSARDWRPEIHDSDGLAIRTGTGERIWRPLANPPRPRTSSFADTGPKGFGLMQRDRDFGHYQDDGVFYEKRPSLWIEPQGNWGKGAVTLYEFPTDTEYADNIVAFWTPERSPRAGDRLVHDYRMRWIGGEPERMAVARAVACRIGQGNIPGKPPSPDIVKFVVDFAGDRFAGLTHKSPVAPRASVSGGRVVNRGCYPVDGQPNLWRLILDIQRDGGQPLDVRAILDMQNQSLTETWLYLLG